MALGKLPPRPRRPRPVRGKNPGLRDAADRRLPSGGGRPWDRAGEIGARVVDHISKLNPFD